MKRYTLILLEDDREVVRVVGSGEIYNNAKVSLDEKNLDVKIEHKFENAVIMLLGWIVEALENRGTDDEEWMDPDELDEDGLWIEEEVLDSLEEERFFLSAIRGERA